MQFPPTYWAKDNRLQPFWTVVGCSVYVGSGPPLSLVDVYGEAFQTQRYQKALLQSYVVCRIIGIFRGPPVGGNILI